MDHYRKADTSFSGKECLVFCTDKPAFCPMIVAALVIFAMVDAPVSFKINIPTREIRAQIASVPVRPLVLFDAQETAEVARKRADDLLREGVWSDEDSEVRLDPPLVWTGYSRSFTFGLNAWRPLDRFLEAHSTTGDPKYFKAAYRLALDWMQTYQAPALAIKTTAELDAAIGRPEDFVWYDMGVGLRINTLAYILDVIARDSSYPDEEVRLFVDGLYFHMEALCREKFFKGHNNHGLYQAMGQLAAARRFWQLPRMSEYEALAQSRLTSLVEKQFSPSGIHLEHSPDYHLMLLQSFLGMRNAGLLSDERFLSMLDRMEAALPWMTAPDFSPVTFGDTHPRIWRMPPNVVEGYRNPQLRYVMSGGESGEAPKSGVAAYKDAGYAFARMIPESGDPRHASYLAQTAAFHSRTHKHADNLSFVWYDQGRHVLADPGRYAYSGKTEPGSPLHNAGFWYSDPKRIYVESTRAHNTVEIDGLDHPRVKVKPFGSALVYAGEQDGLVVTECDATYSGAQRHRRILILAPSEFLLVLDLLSDETAHDYAQRFTFAPDWIAEANAGGVMAKHPAGKSVQVCSLVSESSPLPVARGVTEPQLLGWVSDKPYSLIPASCIGFAQKAVQTARFATLFAFSDRLEADVSEQQIEPDFKEARFAWTSDGMRYELSFTREPGKGILVKRSGSKKPAN
jgi:hypothetical protein